MKRVSFLARKKINRRVSFKSGGRKVSFTARVPSRRRGMISFLARKRR